MNNDNASSTDISALIISQLVASYAQPTPPVSQVMVKIARKVSTPKAAKKEAVKAEITSARDNRPVQFAAPLPVAGTINGKAFLVGMRKAATRDEKINLMAAYTGYNVREDFGSQEMATTMRAQQEVRGAPKALPQPAHSVRPTLTGYVSGKNDLEAKRNLDLLARERCAAEALSNHLLRNANPLSLKLGEVEKERIENIRRQLKVA